VISSNDNKLLIGLVQGNRKAFDAIYRQYFHAVYCNALKLTRDAAASEDMLQEVFIALWEKRATIDTTRSIGGWLFVICYNKSINILRKKLRESLACKAMRQSVEDNDKGVAGYDVQWAMLEEAMSRLSPQKRKVFELCKLQGKTYEETASVLQISKYTVKEYLTAAVGAVKEYVHQHPQSSVAVSSAVVFLSNHS
jgi:RNA polymerase sigma factor (sigma-70 family)